MKLMHFWARTYDTFDSGANLITYTNMSAFKFPDRMQVFLTCNVQVSKSLMNAQHEAGAADTFNYQRIGAF